MHQLLAKYMRKFGITPDNMTEEERQTIERWSPILNEEAVTVEKIVEFCKRQKSLIESKWENRERDRSNDPFLADIHAMYSLLTRMIESPKNERIALEKRLEQMLDKNEQSDI